MTSGNSTLTNGQLRTLFDRVQSLLRPHSPVESPALSVPGGGASGKGPHQASLDEDAPKSTRHQLQIFMDGNSRDRLDALQSALDADTVGEVVRRAVRALQKVLPDDLPSGGAVGSSIKEYDELDAQQSRYGRSHRVTARVSTKTLEIIEQLSSDLNLRQSEVVRHGLRVLTTIVNAEIEGVKLNMVDDKEPDRQVNMPILI